MSSARMHKKELTPRARVEHDGLERRARHLRDERQEFQVVC
jgi:hypothetical protein